MGFEAETSSLSVLNAILRNTVNSLQDSPIGPGFTKVTWALLSFYFSCFSSQL